MELTPERAIWACCDAACELFNAGQVTNAETIAKRAVETLGTAHDTEAVALVQKKAGQFVKCFGELNPEFVKNLFGSLTMIAK